MARVASLPASLPLSPLAEKRQEVIGVFRKMMAGVVFLPEEKTVDQISELLNLELLTYAEEVLKNRDFWSNMLEHFEVMGSFVERVSLKSLLSLAIDQFRRALTVVTDQQKQQLTS